MKIRCAVDIMSSPVITAGEDMRLTEVIDLLLRWHISGLPIVDAQNNVIGIISEHDVMNFAFDGHAADATAGEAMSKNVISFPPETDVETLINCYTSQRIRRVPIVKDGKLVGIVSRRDILREMKRMYGKY